MPQPVLSQVHRQPAAEEMRGVESAPALLLGYFLGRGLFSSRADLGFIMGPCSLVLNHIHLKPSGF